MIFRTGQVLPFGNAKLHPRSLRVGLVEVPDNSQPPSPPGFGGPTQRVPRSFILGSIPQRAKGRSSPALFHLRKYGLTEGQKRRTANGRRLFDRTRLQKDDDRVAFVGIHICDRN